MKLRWVLVWVGLLGLSLPLGRAQGSTVAQFQGLEDKWSVALAHKDQFALENLLLPGMVDISAAGEISTRNQAIANALAGLPEPLASIEQKVVNVRVVSDVAIVEGTYVLRLREGARVRDEKGVFTHVWERVRNTWECVSAQRTAVVDQMEGARGAAVPAAPKKKSDADLPFHIPLVYGGAQAKQPAPPAGSPAPQ